MKGPIDGGRTMTPAAQAEAARASGTPGPARGPAGSPALRFVLELLVVFIGVTGAFLVHDLLQRREREQRARQVYAALTKEVESFVVVGQQMYDSAAAGWEQWQLHYARGDRPAPYYVSLGPLESPPTDVWQATVASGGLGLLDPDVYLDLATYYGRLRVLAEHNRALAAFAESRILPQRSDEGAFYRPSTSRLRGDYDAYHAQRLDVEKEFAQTLELGRAALGKLREHAGS